ncbi:hypothetical protein [Kitasatospora sp. NPDC086791]|uniref:hypothetical protein n=1 Tax=Kitasatospora sp. NPDC086791 TaxID=3155178 RepID=UPI00343EDA2E
MTNHLRVSNGRFVVDGAHGSTYNANDLDTIDANLEDISKRGPDHPDIDRLLDARRIVSLHTTLFGPDTEPEPPA